MTVWELNCRADSQIEVWRGNDTRKHWAFFPGIWVSAFKRVGWSCFESFCAAAVVICLNKGLENWSWNYGVYSEIAYFLASTINHLASICNILLDFARHITYQEEYQESGTQLTINSSVTTIFSEFFFGTQIFQAFTTLHIYLRVGLNF